MYITSFLNYLSFEKRYSPHTIAAYERDLNQFSDFLECTYELPDIENAAAMHVRSWIVHLINKEISARSINRKLSALKSFYRFLMRQGITTTTPMAKIISPKTGRKLPVFLTEKQTQQLFERIAFPSDFAGVRDELVLKLFYATGMRRSELKHLKLTDLDFDKRQIKVLGKGNKERLIPFSSKLNDEIKNYLAVRKTEFPHNQISALILSDTGAAVTSNQLYEIVRYYLSLITTLEKRSPHVLRHTFATHLSDNGADLNAIKELLGHASLASTQVYTHNSIEKLKKVYEQAHPKAKKDDAG